MTIDYEKLKYIDKSRCLKVTNFVLHVHQSRDFARDCDLPVRKLTILVDDITAGQVLM